MLCLWFCHWAVGWLLQFYIHLNRSADRKLHQFPIVKIINVPFQILDYTSYNIVHNDAIDSTISFSMLPMVYAMLRHEHFSGMIVSSHHADILLFGPSNMILMQLWIKWSHFLGRNLLNMPSITGVSITSICIWALVWLLWTFLQWIYIAVGHHRFFILGIEI